MRPGRHLEAVTVGQTRPSFKAGAPPADGHLVGAHAGIGPARRPVHTTREDHQRDRTRSEALPPGRPLRGHRRPDPPGPPGHRLGRPGGFGGGGPGGRGAPCDRGLHHDAGMVPGPQRRQQSDRPVLAQRGQPRRSAGGRRGRPRRIHLRLPPVGWHRCGRLALQRRRPGRLLALGGAHRRLRARHRLRGNGQRVHAEHRRLPGHRPQRVGPVVRAGGQPRHRPHAGLGRRRVADRRELRRGLRSGSRLPRTEHRRPVRRRRKHAGRLPVVLGRLRLLDRRVGRPLRGRHQRNHQRGRLDRGGLLRGDLQQRRPHPHHFEQRQRRDRVALGRARLPVQHHPEHRPVLARRRPVPLGRGRRHRHRRRQLLLGCLRLEQGVRHQHRLWPGVERHPQRHHRRLAGGGQRPGDRARRRRGHPGRHRLRPQRHQRSRRLVGRHEWRGHRLTGDGRPDRRRVPGRHCADHERHRHLRRAFGRAGGDARGQRRVPELPARDRRPGRSYRHHRRRLHPQRLGACGHRRPLGGGRHQRLGFERLRGRRVAAVPPRPTADRRCRDAGPDH